ncbi:hypothetical protein X762_04900 [Mesorhizobium sp. LSHC426A00]|nr:hypothetical protein X762_04900 [Mesorhizobium sp. LSHC426A00]
MPGLRVLIGLPDAGSMLNVFANAPALSMTENEISFLGA